MTIKTELLKLYEKAPDGLLKPQTAVDWARDNPASALYKALEWDDTKAADGYRCEQVRHLIRVTLINNDDGVREMISLTIDRVNPGGGYRDIDRILASEKMTRVMLEDALAELDRVHRKYEALAVLSGVWEEVGRVKTASERKKARDAKRAELSGA